MEKLTKICTKCNCEKELTEFYIRNKIKNTYRSACKQCIKEEDQKNKDHITKRKRKYYENNIEHVRIKSKERYIEKKDILSAQMKEYRLNNLDKLKALNKEYRIKEKENLKIKAKEYYEANKDKMIQDRKDYQFINAEKIAKRKRKYHILNREHIRNYNLKYRKTEIGKYSAINHRHKRRALIKDGDITADQLKELYSKSTNCYWCEDELIKGFIQLDHFVPLSKGGKHTISNLVISCNKCNNLKRAKDPYIFAKEIGKVI